MCAEFEQFAHYYHAELPPERQRNSFKGFMLLCPMCRVHFESYVRTVALGQLICEEEEKLPQEDLRRTSRSDPAGV